jgi:enoyl-CoA hydratase
VTLVHRDVADGVVTITLDDPSRRNALSLDMVEAISAAFDTAEADESVGAIVVTGAPPAFCAGADLSQLGASKEDGLRAIYEGFLRVSRCPLPTLAAVNGAAVGAGVNMALSCDVRLAAASARFDTRFLQLGLHPGGGYTWMLRRIAGIQATMAAGVFSEVLDAAEAERVGLVWRSVPDDALADAAQTMAARAAEAPRDLLMRVKATIGDMAAIDDHAAAVDRELADQVWSLEQPAFAERLAAIQARIAEKKTQT